MKTKFSDITKLTTKSTLNGKINDVKGEIPSITNLANKTAFTAVENKIPSVSNFAKRLTTRQTLKKLKIKLLIITMINIVLLQKLIS